MDQEKGAGEIWRTKASEFLETLRWWVEHASAAREWRTYGDGERYQTEWIRLEDPRTPELERRASTTANAIRFVLRGSAYPNLLMPLGTEEGGYWAQPGIEAAEAAIDRVEGRLEARADPNAIDTDNWRVGEAAQGMLFIERLNRHGDAQQEILCTREEARELAAILATLQSRPVPGPQS